MWPLCKMSWLCRYFDIFCWFFFDNPLWDLCRQYSTCFRWKNKEISRGKWSREFLRFLKNTFSAVKIRFTVIPKPSWVRICHLFRTTTSQYDRRGLRCCAVDQLFGDKVLRRIVKDGGSLHLVREQTTSHKHNNMNSSACG